MAPPFRSVTSPLAETEMLPTPPVEPGSADARIPVIFQIKDFYWCIIPVLVTSFNLGQFFLRKQGIAVNSDFADEDGSGIRQSAGIEFRRDG